MARVGFLGPSGTFHEQALLADPDLAAMELVPMPSIAEVLSATESGDLDAGFVAIENSIEGTVNITMDTLAFETDLLVQKEAVLDIELHLLAPAGRPWPTSAGSAPSRTPPRRCGGSSPRPCPAP
jgi:prephenate dehydratase